MKTKEQILKEAEIEWGLRVGPKSNQREQTGVLLSILSQALTQTREETIREVEDIVNKIIIKDYSKKWGDNVVDFAQDIVNRTTSLIKKELNKLKK